MTTNMIARPKEDCQPLETVWGSRLHAVNDSLYLAGYRAFSVDGSLIVRKPNGTRYLVNPLVGTCTCPARGECKHKRQLTSLVFLSMSELSYKGKFDAYDELSNYWFGYCCELGRTGR